MTNAAQELLATMAGFDLRPPEIIFDHKLHRFKSEGQKGGHRSGSGWYRAFADQRGAVFGCHRSGVDETWQASNANGKTKPTEAERREWAERAASAKADREKKQAAAAIRAQEIWKSAKKASSDHEYLRTKGIGPTGLRQTEDGKKLIAPMRGEDNKIVSLQTITAAGVKKFMTDGWIQGTMASIGSRTASRDIIFVTEGFATASTVNEVTGAPVAVAYYADNLLAVTKAMVEKYPDSTIIIAADNDYWSATRNGWNPGVLAAQAAAEETGAQVAIPTFPDSICQDRECDKECDLAHPTDFNDLHRMLDSVAVRKGLVPTVIAPAAVEETAVDVPDRAAPAEVGWGWDDSDAASPFRCLGHDRDVYYYLPRGGGQIKTRTVAQHDRRHLGNLADASWWEHTFPGGGKEKVDWGAAADAMFRINHKIGVFRVGRIRGRGCWAEKKPDGTPGVLLHLGDELLPAGSSQFVTPETYRASEGQIYEQRGRLNGPHRKEVLGLDETREILSLFEDIQWMEDASALLMAGWTALAPLCGALAWRPHIWVTGGSGSGKTTIIKALVLPLLGGRRQDHGMAEYVDGGTTEAGIRGGLESDARPVIYDEADRDDPRSDGRIQSVLALARSSSSSGAVVQKGTASGKSMSFEVRAMFMLSSIAGSLRQEADKTRVSILQLASVPQGKEEQEARRAHWAALLPRLMKVDDEMGRKLMSRTLMWMRDGRLAKTIEIMKYEAAVVLGDQRSGDQYGTLFAGAWTMQSDEVPDPGEARELLASHGLASYLAEQAPEGERVLRKILQHTVRVDHGSSAPSTHAVGELIEAALPNSDAKLKPDAISFLRMVGIRCDLRDGENVVLMANTSEWIGDILRESMYSDSWTSALRSLPGVYGERSVRFHTGLVSRVTVVPLSALG